MTTTPADKTVLLIGASRGLGLALAEEYFNQGSHVVATVRGSDHTPLHDLADTHPDQLEIETVDITAQDQIDSLRARLADRRFDLLFVNAGTTNDPDETPTDVSTDEFARLMITNALSPVQVIKTLGHLVPETATIAVMSSSQGSIANSGPDAQLTIEESIPRLVATIGSHAGEPGLQFLDYRDQTVAW